MGQYRSWATLTYPLTKEQYNYLKGGSLNPSHGYKGEILLRERQGKFFVFCLSSEYGQDILPRLKGLED